MIAEQNAISGVKQIKKILLNDRIEKFKAQQELKLSRKVEDK